MKHKTGVGRRNTVGGILVVKSVNNYGTKIETILYEEDIVMTVDKEIQKAKHVSHVGGAVGLTMNIGNFESVRIDVWRTDPCLPEDVEDAYENAMTWMEAKVGEQRNAIKNK